MTICVSQTPIRRPAHAHPPASRLSRLDTGRLLRALQQQARTMLLLTGGDDMQSCVCDVGNLVMVGLQRTSRVLFCLQLRTGNRVAARIFAAAAFGCLWLCPV